MVTAQPAELGQELHLTVGLEHRVPPEPHILAGTVRTQEQHMTAPSEHRPVRTKREQHNLEPSVHRLVHKEQHSLVWRSSISRLGQHMMVSASTD